MKSLLLVSKPVKSLMLRFLFQWGGQKAEEGGHEDDSVAHAWQFACFWTGALGSSLSLSEPAVLPNPSSLTFLCVSLCLSVYFSLSQYLFLSLSVSLSLSLSHTAVCVFLFSPLSLRFSLSLSFWLTGCKTLNYLLSHCFSLPLLLTLAPLCFLFSLSPTLSFSLSVSLSVFQCDCLSLCASVSVSLSVCLSLSLALCVCVCLSLSLTVHPDADPCSWQDIKIQEPANSLSVLCRLHFISDTGQVENPSWYLSLLRLATAKVPVTMFVRSWSEITLHKYDFCPQWMTSPALPR